MCKRGQLDEPSWRAEQRSDQIPKERYGDKRVCNPGAGSGHDRVGQRRDPEEQERDGQAVGARFDQRRLERWNWLRDLVAGAPSPEAQPDAAGLPPAE